MTKMIERIDRRQSELEEKREADIARFESKFDRIDQKFDTLSNQMHNLTIGAAIGIATIVIAIFLK